MLKTYPRESGSVLMAQFPGVEDVRQAERAALGVDHGTAGSWLVKAWALPTEFRAIAAQHHDSRQPQDSELLMLVKTACLITNALGFTAVRYSRLPACGDILKSVPPRDNRNPLSEQALRQSIDQKLKVFE